MKWHGAWLYGVHKTCSAKMTTVSCGTSHASTVSTPLRWILKKTKKLWKASQFCRITCKHSECAREWIIALYKSDQQWEWHTWLIESFYYTCTYTLNSTHTTYTSMLSPKRKKAAYQQCFPWWWWGRRVPEVRAVDERGAESDPSPPGLSHLQPMMPQSPCCPPVQ